MKKYEKGDKLIWICGLTLVLLLLTSGLASASNIASQVVTFQVNAINELSVSGNPGSLIISTATAGSELNSVTDSSTTYSLTTNQDARKITGALSSAMPANTQLQLTLAAASGWTSAGAVTLGATAQDLSTGGRRRGSGLGITYGFAATVDAGVVTADTRTVTLTLTAQ